MVVTADDDALRVRVTDLGGHSPIPVVGGGFGLAGLSERVELYGGTIRAGPHGSGFQVDAVIPWEATP